MNGRGMLYCTRKIIFSIQETRFIITELHCLPELNRVNEALIEIKGKCEKKNESVSTGEKEKRARKKNKSLVELIEKLVTISKPPTLSPVGFDGNSRMWGQFISQFGESIHIHKRSDLTPTQKFMYLLSSLKMK
ncbi:hypothetical protein ACH3XW_16245 [Acanthocheilonema viteae]